jgi:hypothetical protein
MIGAIITTVRPTTYVIERTSGSHSIYNGKIRSNFIFSFPGFLYNIKDKIMNVFKKKLMQENILRNLIIMAFVGISLRIIILSFLDINVSTNLGSPIAVLYYLVMAFLSVCLKSKLSIFLVIISFSISYIIKNMLALSIDLGITMYLSTKLSSILESLPDLGSIVSFSQKLLEFLPDLGITMFLSALISSIL